MHCLVFLLNTRCVAFFVSRAILLSTLSTVRQTTMQQVPMDRLLVTTSEREQMVNIAQPVQNLVRSKGWTNGWLKLFCPHTSAAVTFTEGHDPAVGRDFLNTLSRAAPFELGWMHMGNADAHVKSALVGHNLEIFVERGQLMLGSWQGVFFCEFDGPRPREVWLKWLEG